MNWAAADEELDRLKAAGLWNPPAGTAMEILGLDWRELPHSRMLCWLLEPTGSHGLGLRMLVAFLRRLGRDDLTESLCAERIHVQRELVLQGSDDHRDRRADIVVWVDGTPVVIEMKVGAKESTAQTADLEGHFRKIHSSPLFVYLTLDGSGAEHPDFLLMRLRDIAHDLRDALAAARQPTGAAETVGRRTAADYLETLGALTRTNATSQAAARFWLRHGDDHAYGEAKAAAWALLRQLPDRTARVLIEGCATAADDDLRVITRMDVVQGQRELRGERIVLLSRQRWMDERDEPRAGVGLAVRERRHPDDDHWSQENMPYYGIWIPEPALRQALIKQPRRTQPWGSWGVNWEYFPLLLNDAEMDEDPADVYANRAAALIWGLLTAHKADIDAIVHASVD